MNVLIVDNGSKYTERILHIVGRKHLYDVVAYDPHAPIDDTGYDAIVLSGGMVNEVVDTLPDGRAYFHHEFELLRQTELPVMGICLGLQMVTVALGGTLQRLPEFVHEYDYPVTLTEHGKRLFSAEQLLVHERHQWAVDTLEGTGLRVLGESPDCIELLHHPERNMVLTQFHPEYDTEDDELFWSIFDTVAQDTQQEPYEFRNVEEYA